MDIVIILVFAFLILMIVYILYSKGKKNRKAQEKSKADYKNTLMRHEHLKRRLENEQDEAARRVELRNKTLEMYEQVRLQAESKDTPSDQKNRDDAI